MSEIDGTNQFPFQSKGETTFGDPDAQYKLIGGEADSSDEAPYKSAGLPLIGEPMPDLSVRRMTKLTRERKRDLIKRAKARDADAAAELARHLPLSRERELELIIAAQAGDDKAKAELSRHFMGWLRGLARERWRRLASFHRMEFNHADNQVYRDLFAAALEAFWCAVLGFQPSYGWRLSTYASKFVEGALSDATHDHRNGAALKNESDFARTVRAHPDAKPWLLQRLFSDMSLDEIETERAFVWDGCLPIEYSERGNADDDGEYDGDSPGDGFKSSGETIVIGPRTGYSDPISEGSRRLSVQARFYDHKNWVAGKRSGSVFADRAMRDTERRALSRLNRDGARRYAEWLFWRPSTCKPIISTSPSLHTQLPTIRPVRHVDPLPGPSQDETNSTWNMSQANKILRSTGLRRSSSIEESIGATETIQSPPFKRVA
jgi:hypothetical protein